MDGAASQRRSASQYGTRAECRLSISSRPVYLVAVLEAFYVRGESLSQMSESFEAPIGTIKHRLHVARKRLARQLETAAAV